MNYKLKLYLRHFFKIIEASTNYNSYLDNFEKIKVIYQAELGNIYDQLLSLETTM